ncbi:MAG: LPS export ABC transporter periplasmic protein LptC [Alphaproteobacteria bacterium]|nr:LPS export ABC transporter periplasmic protein LptC [Alphaproteobacteria bacterium]
MDTDQTPSRNTPRAHRLDFITPRLTPRMARARLGRGAAVMRKLRLWLPLAALAAVLLLVLWPEIAPSFRLKNVVKNIPNLVIDHLHYKGLDDKNQPYSVSAAQATRPADMNGIYDLTQPEGEITLKNGTWLSGRADYGRYDTTARELWLGGHVHLFHDKGYEFTTEEAEVNLNNNDAWGDKPVLLQGAFGTVRGAGFRFLDDGNTIIFQGPARADLLLHNNNLASDKAAGTVSPSSDTPPR